MLLDHSLCCCLPEGDVARRTRHAGQGYDQLYEEPGALESESSMLLVSTGLNCDTDTARQNEAGCDIENAQEQPFDSCALARGVARDDLNLDCNTFARSYTRAHLG